MPYHRLRSRYMILKFGLKDGDHVTLVQLENIMCQDMSRFWRVYTQGTAVKPVSRRPRATEGERERGSA